MRNASLGPEISATEPDWGREALGDRWWDPSRRLIRTIRRYQRFRKGSGPVASMFRRLAVLEHRFWSVVTGADIPVHSKIQGGLKLPHPNGVVVHPNAEIGPNCILFQQVTVGTGGKGSGVPTLGGHVEVGAGAKILGPIKVGDHAKIGANSVVVRDVPAGATVVGIPARVVKSQPSSPQSKGNVRTLPVVGQSS